MQLKIWQLNYLDYEKVLFMKKQSVIFVSLLAIGFPLSAVWADSGHHDHGMQEVEEGAGHHKKKRRARSWQRGICGGTGWQPGQSQPNYQDKRTRYDAL